HAASRGLHAFPTRRSSDLGPCWTTMEVVRHDWALAREVGVPITVHVGVGENGFWGGIKQMYEEGLLGPDTTYIHCCTLSDEELKDRKSTRLNSSHLGISYA